MIADPIPDTDSTSMEGVNIVLDGVDSLGVWREPMEKRMPEFRDAGWLDGLRAIVITDNWYDGVDGIDRLAGYSMKRKCVVLPKRPRFDRFSIGLVGGTKEATLIHEMTHHVHLSGLDYEDKHELSGSSLDKEMSEILRDSRFDIKRMVSEYATMNWVEMIAETCTGLSLGRTYPTRILKAYKAVGGIEPLGGEVVVIDNE